MCKETNNLNRENGITEGIIWKQLLLFFFPILFGTFFQQLYNTVDAVIVGQFVGKEALSAVGGGTGTVINLLVGFFVGLSGGATVIISQYYGAKQGEMVSFAVHTAIAFSLAGGLVLTVLGILFSPAVLRTMNTPADVLAPSILYIRIYFTGMIGNLIYNIGSGILRAIGDSKRPLYFLIVSCLSNILLDLLFVAVFRMGVAGAALATVCSQLLSAALVIAVLMKTEDVYRLKLRRIGFDRRMFARIIRIGFPAGLQSVMYSLSNIIIQTAINGEGTDTVAAWTVYGKLDVLFWMCVSAFGISVTTFVGQNYGANQLRRARQGVRTCLGMTFASTVVISAILYLTCGEIYRIFTSDPEVLRIGVHMTKFLVPTYVTYICIEILSGALRGAGDVWFPTLICLTGVCAIRVVWIMAAVPVRPGIDTIIFSYPLTWAVTTVMFLIYYCFFSKISIRQTSHEQNRAA
ncbi:MAG: MATE family efflux transporter [bacterium]|nr:MATE family efflux transporter [bacterium]